MKTPVLLTTLASVALSANLAFAQGYEADDAEFPEFSIYTNEDSGAYIKPIVQVAGGVEHLFTRNPVREEAANIDFGDRITTFALARLGFEGNAGHGVSFKMELQRDPGVYGTGTWEGTVSLSAREMWARYAKYGASVAVGVVEDPASVDFFSIHTADTLISDRYTRNPLLHSGFNRGQGLIARYDFAHLAPELPLTLGMAFTSGNPLASSTSYPWGGPVSNIGNGELNYIPRGAMNDGNPGSPDTEMQLYSPSLVFAKKFSDDFALEMRAAAQFYRVFLNKSDSANDHLTGRNLRGTMRLGFLDDMISVFGGGSFRENQMYESDEVTGNFDYTTISPDRFKAYTVHSGLDFTYDKTVGLGGSYATYGFKLDGVVRRFDYINVGASWFMTDTMTLGLRRAFFITRTEGEWDDGVADTASWYLGMRLMI